MAVPLHSTSLQHRCQTSLFRPRLRLGNTIRFSQPQRHVRAFPVVRASKDDQDKEREIARTFRRVVYDAQKWEEHRSINRYNAHIFSMPTSRIFLGLLTPMLYVASICAGVGTYHSALEFGLIQHLAPDVDWPTLTLNSSGIFGISTFALSLLLVFRTNSSYERWWEARDCWRLVVNECTHLARQAEQWLPGAGHQPVRHALLRWLRVFPYTLMEHLRQPDEEHRKVIQQILMPEETVLLLDSRNPPLMVLAAIGQLLAASEMRIESKTHMDESVRQLQEALGSCEKILTTPIPVSYTRHTGRFLVLWLTCLPFVIWDELGWFSVPISMIVSFLLFGIEEIGVQIEEPFGILALETFCDEVQTGIDQAETDADKLRPIIAKIAAASAAALAAAESVAAAAAAAPGNGTAAAGGVGLQHNGIGAAAAAAASGVADSSARQMYN